MGYTEFQRSAIQEIGNIGTGTAATALSQMVGVSIEIDPPHLDIVPLEEATERVGPPEKPIIAVLTPVVGDVPANILLAFSYEAAAALCSLLGTDPMSEIGRSALQEIGNVLTSSYVTAIGQMIGRNRLEVVVAQGLVEEVGSRARLRNVTLVIHHRHVVDADVTDRAAIQVGLLGHAHQRRVAAMRARYVIAVLAEYVEALSPIGVIGIDRFAFPFLKEVVQTVGLNRIAVYGAGRSISSNLRRVGGRCAPAAG